MATLLFKNNASTTLSGSINNTQTLITVASSSGFPTIAGSDYFYATMYEVSGNPATEINIEIVKVTAVSGSNWTVVRAQDDTTARSRDGVTTCYIELRWTAASSALMLQKDRNLADLTNAATARTNLGLGSIATQEANNVSITGGTISGVTFETLDSNTSIADNVDSTKKVRFEVSGVTTATTRVLTIPDADGTLATTAAVAAGYQPLDSDLTAVAGLSATGLIARTGTGTAAVRTLTAPAAGITVTNGNGVSGNPTLALANDLAAAEAINTTGFVRRTATDTWSASAIVDGDLPSALTGKTYNALTLTANATGFSVAGGTTSKTLTVNNSITIAGTDATTITLPATTGTVALNNQSFFLGTSLIAINRGSGSISLTGVNIDGSAGSATSATSATTATNLAGGNSTTLLGSLPYQSNTNTTTLLAPNTTANKRFLRMTGTGTNGAAPAWDSVTSSDVGLGNVENTALSTWAGSSSITTLGTVATGTWNASTIGIAKGGTGQTTAVAAFDALAPTTTLGDLVFHNGTDNVRLAGNTTTSRRFLRQTGTGTVSAAPAWDGLTDGDIPSLLTGKTYNGLTLTAAATGFTVAGGTTSKTLTISNTLTLAGTDSSTLNIGAGGTLGSAAFTASTAYAPAAGSSSITTVGTIGSGTWQGSAIGVSYGGTGSTSKTAGFNALSPVTTLGDLIYGDGANSNTRLAGNTTTSKRFLTQTGTGSVSAAPGWNAILNGDLPSALTGKTYNGITLTANATGFSVAGGTTSKTLQVNNNLTLSGTDGSTLNIGGGGTLGSAAYTASTAYQPVDADLTAIAALAGTSGFLKKTAANTWSLDTNTYLTGNQSISITGDATGSGTTSIALTLANSGATAGTYKSVTVNAKGLVTGGTNPTTLAGYGITDAQALDADLTAIAGLAGTSGFLKKTAANTWSLDTSTYLTGNQSITLSGDVSGTGSTAISVTLATVTAAKGGTGQTSYTIGDLLYASSSSALSKLAGVATGNALLSGGVATAPSWGKVGLTTHVSGTLGVGNGGTGATTLTGILKGNGTSAFTAVTAPSGALVGTSDTQTLTNKTLSSPTLSGVVNGDFSNATATSRVAFQTSTASSNTTIDGIPSLASGTMQWVSWDSSDRDNGGYGYIGIDGSYYRIDTGKTGTGTIKPFRILTGGVQRVVFGASGGADFSTALRESRTAMGADDIDAQASNYFTKTISGATTFTVSNVPAAGTSASFILDLTNGGSAAITWWSGVKWAGGTAPTLTSAGRDVLGFFTHDAGTTWTGLLLGKDVK